MIFPSLEEIERKVHSRFLLTVVVAERAKQIRGAGRRIPADDSGHPITLALEELRDADIAVDLSRQLDPGEFRADDPGLAPQVEPQTPESLAGKEEVVEGQESE
jgi:DNA-directed RNA polymerase subunit K/omega